MLIEVMISALVLGLVAVATITGVQAINVNSANQRFHNEAALLAAQSQEQLRSDPISLLEKLVRQSNTYSTKVDGIIHPGHPAGLAAERVRQKHHLHGDRTHDDHGQLPHNLLRDVALTSSQATLVTESSIITPPTGSSLQVNVENAEPGWLASPA